ncbi:putative LPS assembly protein LptD [uncultured Fibrobacter sp.]|uniref:putative LPS assembly protein LptD n=1 Tax=uncultured Fibrobacter sp. TaxID=261512 RepID=UPI0025D43EB6|nr:putative LPS assembly protein LptD [uncultured Fibrobacter sp.]
MLFAIGALDAPAVFGAEMTRFELEEREQPVEDTTEVDWMNDTTGTDTIEYRAVDLIYDVEKETFNLNNSAQLKYRTATLDADTIWFDQKNSVLVAGGQPILRETKNPSLSGMRLKYNMNSRIGEIYYATTFQDNQQLNGMEVRRLPDQRIQIARGDFSTCNDSTHQHFYFYGRRMVVKPKETITARPVVLNIADVPVAVLPMIVAPLKSGRKSGLLTPKFGGDQVQGYYMRNIGFYYAPNDYWDATISGDIIEGEEARFEKSSLKGEVRYKKRDLLDGNLSYTAYLDEFDFGKSDYDIRYSHNQNLTPDARHKLTGTGSFVSNTKVRRENALDAETILDQQANAWLTYSGKFGTNKSLTVKAGQNHNLQTGYMERQLPDVQFNMSGPLFTFETDEDETAVEDNSFRSYLQKLNYSFTNRFNYKMVTALDSVNDMDTTAKYVGYSGTYSLDYSGSLFNVINLTPRATWSGYWTGQSWINPDDSSKYWKRRTSLDPEHDTFGEFAYNHNYSLTADTKLYGIWVPEIGRFTGLRHILSPSISYTYAPEIDTVKYFAPHPDLGQSPYQKEQQTIGFSLGNDLDLKYLKVVGHKADTTKGDTAKAVEDQYGNRRLLTTRHSVSYNFAADSLNFSDINSSFGFQILPDYLFTITTRHSFYHKYSMEPTKVQVPELTYWGYELSRSFNWSGTLNAGLPSQMGKYEMRKWSLGLTYRYSFSSTRVGKDLFQDNVNHSTSITASFQPTINWEVSYSTQYDYNEGKFVTHRFTFNRALHCWQLDFTWTPTGPAAGWSFAIYVRDLPDIKLNAGSTESSK